MNIEEAIVHCRDKAADHTNCDRCREEHAQLAVWLEELKARRSNDSKKGNPANTFEAVIIELNNMRDDSMVTGAEERNAAIDEAIWAIRKRIQVPLVEFKGRTTDNDGKEIVVKQPGCPICGEVILNAAQRKVKFCPTCGQALRLGYLQ